jgi:hypothetical protein
MRQLRRQKLARRCTWAARTITFTPWISRNTLSMQSGRDAEAKKMIDDLSDVHGVDANRVAYAKLEWF